jgi:hypothetical protein
VHLAAKAAVARAAAKAAVARAVELSAAESRVGDVASPADEGWLEVVDEQEGAAEGMPTPLIKKGTSTRCWGTSRSEGCCRRRGCIASLSS